MVRYWKVSVIREAEDAYICREYGKHGGKPIINKKLITVAKSKQTAYDQAVFEAERDWTEMKTKKGYVADLSSLTTTSAQLGGGGGAEPPHSPPGVTMPHSPPEEIMSQRERCWQALARAAPEVEPLLLEENGSTSPRKKVIVRKIPPQGVTSGVIAPLGELPTGGSRGGSAPPFKFLPMLANKYLERKKYVNFPCMVQPKLDGVRYTARKTSPTSVVLKTRNDSECPFFEEVKTAIIQLDLDANVLLDGEFYSKRIPFRTLNGYCNRKKMEGKTGFGLIPHEDLESIHYYIFDCYFISEPKKPFAERFQYLQQLLSGIEMRTPYLKLVPITTVNQESELMPHHDQFVEDGYEGLMIRNINGSYKLKDRSNDLLKYKNFFDTEFTIVGAKTPQNGKEEGCIIWELKLPTSDETFTCRPRDTYESRKADWVEFNSNPGQFVGKPYTVRYQETYDNGIPRFPVGIAIRYDLE